MVEYKKWISILIKVTAWFMKVGLVILGLILLFTPGYALYLHALGLISVVIGILTFNRTQQRLLAERGIRIPNAVVAVLLIGGILAMALLTPGAETIELSNEQAELNNGDLVFQMDATNTGDGPTLGSVYFKYEVRVNGEKITETEVDEREFNRGETQTITKNLLSLSDLDQSVRRQIEEGNYVIIVYLQNSKDSDNPRTERYQGSDLS